MDRLLFIVTVQALNIFENPVNNSRTKHIDVIHHFLRENVAKGNVKLIFVATDDQLADILTNS